MICQANQIKVAEAIKNNKVAKVKTLLRKQPDLTSGPLLCFAESVEMMEALLSAGVNPKTTDAKGNTALHRTSNPDVVRALIKRGLSVEATNKRGQSPLHCARTPDVVEELILNGASLEARDNQLRTPLITAAPHESPDIALLLLGEGADPGARDQSGRTAMHWARSQKLVKQMLNAGADPETRNHLGGTPLHDARFVAVAKALIDAGAYVNAQDNLGYTPLHHATRIGLPDVIGLLLLFGARVNAQTSAPIPENPMLNDVTPLHLAHTTEIARILLSAGANPTIKTSHGVTPIYRFAYLGQLDILEMLFFEFNVAPFIPSPFGDEALPGTLPTETEEFMARVMDVENAADRATGIAAFKAWRADQATPLSWWQRFLNALS